MDKNFYIKNESNFKLYIPYKDTITFEHQLNKNKIDFYTDLDEQPLIDEGIRYFLLEKDRLKIDQIIKTNKIHSGIESIGVVDYLDTKKTQALSVKIFFIGFILILILWGVLDIYDNYFNQ